MPLLKDTNLTEQDRINPKDVTLLRDEIAARVIEEGSHIGSFYIPKDARQKTNMAKVIAVGQQYTGPVKPGDIVVYGTWEGKAWPADPDEKTLLLSPDNIHGIVESDA